MTGRERRKFLPPIVFLTCTHRVINSFALIGAGVWTLVISVAVAVGTYIFVKHNKNKVAKIDAAVDEVKDKLSK